MIFERMCFSLLKGQCQVVFNPHASEPLSDVFKPFRIWLRFHGDTRIESSIFFPETVSSIEIKQTLKCYINNFQLGLSNIAAKSKPYE